jgi:hypothetical protein
MVVPVCVMAHFDGPRKQEFACDMEPTRLEGNPIAIRFGKTRDVVMFLEPEHIDQIEAAIARYRQETAAQPTEDTADQATLSTQKG